MAEPRTEPTPSSDEATPKVTGVGGIFFFADNPLELTTWYAQNLGFATTEWGASFESSNASRPEERTHLQWSPFKTGDDYFAPSTKGFMLNYRVRNLEGLIQQLRENGVTILDDLVRYDYGSFVHILDPEGNKIELWEPN
ncbi:glyoxalase [Hymenobacter crusticola]|uniref:Glyoxalase n=2 Tax=Hymenobacter crusticola TaxID=1770526 RepID=A0A243W5W0_9BACT|nr:glyoxalase [Hymenobacter crusticola]